MLNKILETSRIRILKLLIHLIIIILLHIKLVLLWWRIERSLPLLLLLMPQMGWSHEAVAHLVIVELVSLPVVVHWWSQVRRTHVHHVSH